MELISYDIGYAALRKLHRAHVQAKYHKIMSFYVYIWNSFIIIRIKFLSKTEFERVPEHLITIYQNYFSWLIWNHFKALFGTPYTAYATSFWFRTDLV